MKFLLTNREKDGTIIPQFEKGNKNYDYNSTIYFFSYFFYHKKIYTKQDFQRNNKKIRTINLFLFL